jgi:hypothetical protein
MKWFDNWFRRKCKEAWDTRNEPANPYPSNLVAASAKYAGHGSLDSHGLTLSIYGADGGTVLEFRHYDHNKDRSDYSLHVISQSENFEERVAHAITMEMMRKGIGR